MGLGERCKLPQRGLGWSPSRNWIWCILTLKSNICGNKFIDFCENQLTKFCTVYTMKAIFFIVYETCKHTTQYYFCLKFFVAPLLWAPVHWTAWTPGFYAIVLYLAYCMTSWAKEGTTGRCIQQLCSTSKIIGHIMLYKATKRLKHLDTEIWVILH